MYKFVCFLLTKNNVNRTIQANQCLGNKSYLPINISDVKQTKEYLGLL